MRGLENVSVAQRIYPNFTSISYSRVVIAIAVQAFASHKEIKKSDFEKCQCHDGCSPFLAGLSCSKLEFTSADHSDMELGANRNNTKCVVTGSADSHLCTARGKAYSILLALSSDPFVHF